MNKLTKIVLSFLMVITCINFSTVQAEDGEEVNYSEPTTVETVSEDPANEVEQEVAQEEPAVEEEATVEEAPAEQPAEEAAPVEEPQQEEVAPEANEEAQVEEANNAPEEAASEEATVAAEPQQEEATATPEETQEEAEEEPAEVQKATVEISYVDEEDKEIADKVSDKEFDVDFVVTADDKEVYKDIDGYTFKEAIVNDDAENRTFTADTIKLDGLKVTSDMNKVKLVYSKNPVATKKDTTAKKSPKKTSGLLGALEKAVDTLTGKTEEASDDADPLSTSNETRLEEFFVVADRNTVTVGDKTKVSVTIKPDNYPNKDVTWTTSDSDVAEVDENGVVTTKKVGTVTITATLKSDATVTSSTTIAVEAVKVNKITITGYTQEYLEVGGNNVTLGTTIEPEDAVNKDIIWSSSNPEVATVENGVVTAVAQGTTTITAQNEVSGVYGTQKITVYDSTPCKATVNVWVTNRNKNVSYNFYVAKDGTEVNVSDIKQNTSNGSGENYISKGEIRVIPDLSGSANWAEIQAYPIVQAFRYSEDQLQYTTDGGETWKNVNVGYDSIYDFSAMQYNSKYSGAFNKSDIAVIIGDWPYDANQYTTHTKQTIQIVMLDTEHNNTEIYNSGKMRYDNGSSGEYGKINFNSETSKYEVTRVQVYKINNKTLKEELQKEYNSKESIPSDLSVSFRSEVSSHYVIKAYAAAKRINVSYDAEGAEEIPEATTVKTIEKVAVAKQVPKKEGYIFVGWQYNGRTYRGGDELEASSKDIVFTARFVPASEVINYTVNDSSMGSVSRTYERVGGTVTSKLVGSTAIAKTGHKFVKWMNADGKQVSTEVKFVPEDRTPTTYTAVFEKIQSNLTIHYKDEKGITIRADEIKKLSYGESWTEVAPDIQGYTKPSETTQTGTMGVKNEEITFTYTQKVGKVVYNLGPNGSWGTDGAPDNVVISANETEAKKGKWEYTYGFDKGDKFVVTEKVPVSSDNAAFVGWYDKKRDDKPAAMRTKGTELTYPYTTSSPKNTYTLDALWEKLSGQSDTVTYDGNPHRLNANAFTVVFANTNLDKWTDSASSLVQASNIQYRVKQDNRALNNWGEMPSFTDAGKYTIEAKATVNGVELTAEATLTINPRPVTLKSANLNKKYDGNALVNGATALATETGWAEGEGARYTFTGSQTVVGSSDNTFSYTLNSNTKAANYDITVLNGTLTVENRDAKYEITVKANSETATYDGKAHTAAGVKATTFEVDGNTYTVSGLNTENPTATDAGEYTNNITGTAVVKDAAGNDVTSQFTVKPENGKLIINKAAVTLKSANLNKKYDGNALVNGATALATETGWAEGEGARYTFTGSQTVVGSSDNTFSYTLNSNTKAANYDITVLNGTLTVNPYDEAIIAKVSGTKATYVYDGTEYSVSGFTVEFEKPDGTPTSLSGASVVLKPGEKAQASGTAAGNYKMNLNASNFEWKDANFSNVTISIAEDGLLTITPASIDPELPNPTDPDNPTENTRFDVTGLTDVLYNGAEQKQTPTIKDTTTGKDLVKDTDYTITCNTEDFTNAGTITYTIKGKGNYSGTREVSYNINKRTVNLKSDTASKIYDGTALTRPDVTVTGDGFVEGEVTDLRASGSVTTVAEGEVDNAIEYTEGDSFKAGNYNISYDVGTLMIVASDEEAIVVIKGHKATLEYDGTEKAVYGYDVVSITEGSKYTANDFMLTTAAEAKGTEAGTYEMGLKAEDFVNLSDNFTKVTFKVEDGSLTITPKTITPDQPGTPEEEKTGITVENPGDVKYDGKDHAEKPVIKDEKTGVTLEEGKDYEIVYPEDIKNAGEITATVVGKGDYDGSFEIKFNILKRDVTFTSATDSKQYDGNALTNGNVEITGDGFIEGEGATFNVTGSITDVGSTNNAFTYAMNEGTNADNYNVTVVEGTLTVSEQPVVPTPVTPTTPSNNTPARTNNVPARAVTNPTTTTPAPEATVEPEKAETTPAPTAKPEKIKEEATPQAAPKGHWALINLIAAMLSVVLAVVALLAKHAKDEDDEDKDDQVVANENEDDDENESTRHRRWKVIATIDAILAVVVFILTENISLPMVLVDKWTLLMVLFGLISIVSTYFARKWHEEDEDEDEESSQNA